jgi:hypothetical protein
MTKSKISKKAKVNYPTGGNGYGWDLGSVAFNNPLDASKKREFMKKFQEDYRETKIKSK